MSRQAWTYIWSVLLIASGLALWTLGSVIHSAAQWSTLVVLTILATFAQIYRVEAPSHQAYYATFVFWCAGIFLLQPFFLVILITIPHIIQYFKIRSIDKSSALVQTWYLQPF